VRGCSSGKGVPLEMLSDAVVYDSTVPVVPSSALVLTGSPVPKVKVWHQPCARRVAVLSYAIRCAGHLEVEGKS
jgi:hypothetical protein